MEEDLSAIGFLFDACHEKEILVVPLEKGYNLKIKTIGTTPGHKQSGQYVWPASIIASNYFINHWGDDEGLRSARILELGAGCGITGLALSKLENVEKIVFTDYDYGTLDLIKESIELNKNESIGRCVEFVVDFLQWGNCPADHKTRLVQTNWIEEEKFNLIVGSDLIYSQDVVIPLFQTVKHFLSEGGKFVLTTSFSLGDDIEAKIHWICSSLSLERQLVESGEDQGEPWRIEHYTKL
jgi:predicted nicotinamide N-methyase